MTTPTIAATEALDRLKADSTRPAGVTAWCDEHRADIELAMGELGHVVVANAVGMVPSALSNWCQRRSIAIPQIGEMKGRSGPKPMPADAAPTMVSTTVTLVEHPLPKPASAKHECLEIRIPAVLWDLAIAQQWTSRRIQEVQYCRLKRVELRTAEDWVALAKLHAEHPGLLVDSRVRDNR